MTYCFGLKTGDSVTIVGDSALTVSNPSIINHQTTSLGVQEANGSFDGLVKVHNLGRVILAVSWADMDGVIRIIERLSQYLENPVNSPLDSINETLRAARPNNGFGGVSFLFGFYDGEPKLYRYTDINRENRLEEVDGLVQIGSGSTEFGPEFRKTVENILAQNLSRQDSFASLLTAFAIYTINPRSIEIGVGGAICGLSIDENGVHEQPDILLFLPCRTVATAVFTRSGLLFTLSSIEGRTKAYGQFHYDSTQAQRAFIQHKPEVIRKYASAEFHYLALIYGDSNSLLLKIDEGNSGNGFRVQMGNDKLPVIHFDEPDREFIPPNPREIILLT